MSPGIAETLAWLAAVIGLIALIAIVIIIVVGFAGSEADERRIRADELRQDAEDRRATASWADVLAPADRKRNARAEAWLRGRLKVAVDQREEAS